MLNFHQGNTRWRKQKKKQKQNTHRGKNGWRENSCQQILKSSWRPSHCQNFQPTDKKSRYSSPIGSKGTTSFICDCCKSICSSSGYVIRSLACGNTITCKTCYNMLGSSLTFMINNPKLFLFTCDFCRKERGSNNYTNMCNCCSKKILGTSLMDCLNNPEKY